MGPPRQAARTAGLDNPLLRTFQSGFGRPGIMSFGAGFMNPAGFDVARVRAIFAAAHAEDQALSISRHTSVSDVEGLWRLAATLADTPVHAGARQ